jgi:low affinity Fe/Cu permease
VEQRFVRFSDWAAHATGTSYAFGGAAFIILAWALSGPVFHFSDTWQLVINTGTTIVTFLMVFLIQNTQNRDTRALHKKIDDLIQAIPAAHNELVGIEKRPEASEEDG